MNNQAYASFAEVRKELVDSLADPYTPGADGESLDFALIHAPVTSALRILHPLFVRKWKEPRRQISDHVIPIVGLDVETEATTGEPRMLGYWYHDDNCYYCDDAPTLATLFRTIRNLRDQSTAQLAVWGRLDLNILIRLFQPNEKERLRISRSLTGRAVAGQIVTRFPCMRLVSGHPFYVAQYIPGRALRLGWIEAGREMRIWVYNLSQFFGATIAQTARGMGLDWIDYPRETHIVEWERYGLDAEYRATVRASNTQDAKTVAFLATRVQEDFSQVFSGSYPKHLISPGSLCDSATASLLEGDDYNACSWVWNKRNTWRKADTTQCECLLAEAFSAGMIDQYAIGAFPALWTADISAAYPYQIRRLPDLRYATLHYGAGNLDVDLRQMAEQGEVETAIIRGEVTIPDSLPFHPITIRNWQRQNYRPIGTFRAGYTLEERRFCERYGATFRDESYCIITLSERHPSPLARVSEQLGNFRAHYLAQMSGVDRDSDQWRTLNARQYLVKQIDNSQYGKTIMSLEIMDDSTGEPRIVGYTTGDRFNQLYTVLITSRTRILVSEALMAIYSAGGSPVLAMTDSVYWQGSADMLPVSMQAPVKLPGKFESPEEVTDFYLLKVGQYEYASHGRYEHKLRGLPVSMDILTSQAPFLRPLVLGADPSLAAKDVKVSLSTRRLSTIGRVDIERLGAILQCETEIKPFHLSAKQGAVSFDWTQCLNGHVWLPPPTAPSRDTLPYEWLGKLYQLRHQAANESHNTAHAVAQWRYRDRRKLTEMLYYWSKERGVK